MYLHYKMEEINFAISRVLKVNVLRKGGSGGYNQEATYLKFN